MKISSFALLVTAVLFSVTSTAARHWQYRSTGRALLQQNLPANQDAYEAALNATGTGRQSLSLYGSPNATLINLVNYALLAHEAAEEVFSTAATGQVSATLGGAAAAGASLLATTTVLANDSSASSDAHSALNAADSYVRAIRDENPLLTGNATFANLILLANLAHDGTLIQYYQNLTAGQAQDNETFADSVSTVPDLVETAQTQLSRGASPAIALTTMEIAVRNILGASYVYNANAAAAYQEGVSEARLILKAVNSYQTSASCSTDVDAAVSAVEAALEATATAAEDPTPTSVQAAAEAATSAVAATSCTNLSPALAPAPSAQTTSSGGR